MQSALKVGGVASTLFRNITGMCRRDTTHIRPDDWLYNPYL